MRNFPECKREADLLGLASHLRMRLLGGSLTGRRQRDSQSCERFLRFLLPFGAAESLRADGVPSASLVRALSFLFDERQLPCDHGVACALEKFGKFRMRVGS